MADKTQKFLASLYQQAGRDATANPQMAGQGTSDPMQALATLWRAANYNIFPGVAQPDINAGLDAVAQQAGNYVGGLTNPTVGNIVKAGVSLAAPGPKENAVGLAGRMAEGGHEISAGQRMGQFMGRENFSRAGAGYAKAAPNISADVNALRQTVAKELGLGHDITQVSEEVGRRITLEQANHLWQERKKFQPAFSAKLAEYKRTGTKMPRNISTEGYEGSQVPQEIVARFVDKKFGGQLGTKNFNDAEIEARLNWLNGGGDPRNFPR